MHVRLHFLESNIFTFSQRVTVLPLIGGSDVPVRLVLLSVQDLSKKRAQFTKGGLYALIINE